MITLDKSLILFKKPEFGLPEAHVELTKCGLSVTPQADALSVQWGDGPVLVVRHLRGPQITIQIMRFAKGTDYAPELAAFDSLFQITFEDLDETLDEINTLIEVQATLQNAVDGFLYNTWNQQLSPPEK